MSDETTAVIGLEIHVRLATRRKLFCDCAVVDDAPPNTHTCPVCRGAPGAMPRLNPHAARLAARAAIVLGCELAPTFAFDRKHYLWPDLPKGFQITGQERPHGRGGLVSGDRTFLEFTQVHLEEDAGRFRDGDGRLHLDDNRAGVPLLEVTTAPTLPNAVEAEAVARNVHHVLVAAGVTEGRLHRGHLRVDANVSLRREDGHPGPRVELKNLGSFRWVREAIDHEIARQRRTLASGGAVVRETRAWDGRDSHLLRAKEATRDYRLLPEPNLPPTVVPADAAADLPHPFQGWLAKQRLDQLTRGQAQGMSLHLLATLTRDDHVLLEATIAAGAPADEAARWIVGPLRGDGVEPTQLTGADLADLIARVHLGDLTRTAARRVAVELTGEGGSIDAIVDRLGLSTVTAVDALVTQALAQHPDEAARWLGGDDRLTGWFVGQVMRATRGAADPAAVHATLARVRRERVG